MKKAIFVLIGAGLLGGAAFIWSGVYNIGATDKHWAITNMVIEILRERSIEVRAKEIAMPVSPVDPVRVVAAAANYAEMCSICHLAPGAEVTEVHEGLYPQPPVFSNAVHDAHDSRNNFWVIKNGIKLTGMPAWGASHTDEEIWALVDFIQKLGKMSAEDYLMLTTGAAETLPH